VSDDLTVLALDVSSSAAGYALALPGGRTDFGVIVPPGDAKAVERIDGIVGAMGRLLARHRPALAVMEWSDGHVHGAIRRRTSGLSVMGAAQGAVRQFLRAEGIPVETVGESTWTRRIRKVERAARMRVVFPAYGRWADEGADEGADDGMDAADALGILEWWRGEQRAKALVGIKG
jgi:hypothetical protein